MTSNIIPEELVEATWEEVAGFSEATAESEMHGVAERQPALLALVLAGTEDLGQEAQELAFYLFFVVLRMYERHFGESLRTVAFDVVERQHEKTQMAFESLIGTNEDRLEEAALAGGRRQPHLMRFIAECVFEPDDDDLPIPEEEIGALFTTMKTVIDALDDTVDSPSAEGK